VSVIIANLPFLLSDYSISNSVNNVNLQSNNTILEGLKINPLRTFPLTGRVQILYEYTNVTNYTFQYYNGSKLNLYIRGSEKRLCCE